MGPRGPPGPPGAPVSKCTCSYNYFILPTYWKIQKIADYILNRSHYWWERYEYHVSTHQCQHCHLFPFQGPQGFQGNPGETGEPGPAVSVPDLAGFKNKPTYMTFICPHTYYMAHTDDTFICTLTMTWLYRQRWYIQFTMTQYSLINF